MLQLDKPLSSLTHEDMLAYERFLADPQPAACWVLAGTRKNARGWSPNRRPFAGPLTAKARQYGFDEAQESQDMFLRQFDKLRANRIIP